MKAVFPVGVFERNKLLLFDWLFFLPKWFQNVVYCSTNSFNQFEAHWFLFCLSLRKMFGSCAWNLSTEPNHLWWKILPELQTVVVFCWYFFCADRLKLNVCSVERWFPNYFVINFIDGCSRWLKKFAVVLCSSKMLLNCCQVSVRFYSIFSKRNSVILFSIFKVILLVVNTKSFFIYLKRARKIFSKCSFYFQFIFFDLQFFDSDYLLRTNGESDSVL